MEKIKPTELESVIESVTVFTDRALVTRKAKVALKAGESRLVFSNLPESLEESSIQVSGTGAVVLKDIRCAHVFFSEMKGTERRKLTDEKLKIEDRLREIQDAIGLAEQEKRFLEGIVGRITGVTEQSGPGDLDPGKWTQMIEFHKLRMDAVAAALRAHEIRKREIMDALQAVTAKTAAAGEAREWVKHQVEVLLEAPGDGEVSLAVSYLVTGPSWAPVYNLRVRSDEDIMSVEYNALVRQNTLEDWKDVDLKLSTAQPQISGTVPTLSAWFVDIVRPMPPIAPPRMVTASAPGFGMKKRAAKMDEDFESGIDRDEAEEPAPEIQRPAAEVVTGAASVIFAIPGKTNVKSDNNDYQVSIMRENFKAEFNYETVPKAAPYAYLRAKVTNTSEYPFLPGKTYIYLDGCFVANSRLDFTAPEEEFWTSLGIDEAMKVECKLLKRLVKKGGALSKRESIIWEYRIDITNNKKRPYTLVLKDQIPVSGNQDIVVKLLGPEYKQDTDALTKNDENILTWTITAEPKKTISIPFSFSVEYPAGVRIGGL